ncbi:peptidoglycan glycosyltransferase [Actinomadura spongiicola]|uniref:Peptidoglycan glycosyltransferase n=2 Tax=Actinomadura spongiicola TaxID=2303421 RepID=A0A372GJE1_9ACTN|nr:penicillin-binding protein 2 [Actinomadura spongiicola]RFS85312.1 peptidoglycan glycosyltransferase [Actinomadura spongiicola]
MTRRPGRGPAGPSAGRKRGSDGSGRPGTKGGAARRPSRGGTVPPPPKEAPRKEAPRKEAPRKEAPRKPKETKPKETSRKPKEAPRKAAPAQKKPPAKSTPPKGTPVKGASVKGASVKGVVKGRVSGTARSGPAGKPGNGAGRRGPGGGGPSGGGPGRRPPGRGPRTRAPFHRRDPLKRLNIGLLVIAFVLSLFAGRLVQLQTIESGKYTEQAMRQRLQRIDLPAIRGDITDAQGHPLAMTVEARAIYADPSLIKAEKRQPIVNALAPTLGLNPATLMQKISRTGTRFVYLAHGVRPDQARLIRSWNLPGIGTWPEYRREYPNESLAAGVIGFVNDTGNGAAGLESSLNDVLAGRDGRQWVEISPEGQHIPMGKDQKLPSVPGRDLRLTLQRDLQFMAQRAIEKQVRASRAKSGSVIVMEPRTGRLLAMASAPGFDPNRYTRSDRRLWGSPLVQEAYEPGSTGKVVTAAAVMEHGGVTPQTPYTVPDRIKKYDTVFGDSHRHPPERLTFAGVLATSSNVGTILASQSISSQRLYGTLREFGFGRKTGLPLPGETAGLLKPPSQWSGTDHYSIAFGQTLSVNAVQMASVYATIANGGVRVAPTLVEGTVGEDDKFTPAPAPERRQVISAKTARQISDMLEGVTTEEGTAPKAQIPGYRVAGKTGTAQMVNPRCGCYKGGGYVASFAGFAPADDPRLVVQVVLRDPKRGSHYGGDAAAPVFRDVMGFALQSQRIPPTGSRPPTVQIHARD